MRTDSYVYDRRGRGLVTQHLLAAGQTPAQDAYEYDSLNRLISISHLGTTQETLAYDGLGDLAARTFNGGPDIARYYVGDDFTAVLRSSMKIGYVHIRLGGKRIASLWAKASGTTNTTGVIYYHRDYRGDVIATTTNGGQMGVSYRYLPSGAVDKTIGAEADENASELGFIGGLKLSGGLVHLKARAYSPALRRFLQADTVDLRRYTYAHGDVLNFVDPSGMDACAGHEAGTCGTIINNGPGNGSPQSSPQDDPLPPSGITSQPLDLSQPPTTFVQNEPLAPVQEPPPPSMGPIDNGAAGGSALGGSGMVSTEVGLVGSGGSPRTSGEGTGGQYSAWSITYGGPPFSRGWGITYTEVTIGGRHVASLGFGWGKTLALFGLLGYSRTVGRVLSAQGEPAIPSDSPTIDPPCNHSADYITGGGT